MRMHPRVAIPAIALALLLGTAEPGQAQQPKKDARDFARLMPANSLVYAGMNHPQMIKQLLAMIKESAFNDYAGFRDDLYRRLKLEADSEGFFSQPPSTWLASVLTPEILDEIGRINGFALAVIDGAGRGGGKEGHPEPGYVWAIDPGTSNIVKLIVRDTLTLSSSMKSVRIVEGVRLYQSFLPAGPKAVHEPVGSVLATMPGLIVVGSDADLVADVIRRERGKQEKDTPPALADLPEFQQFAEVHKNRQMFSFANLGKLDSLLKANSTGLATLFDYKSLLGADSCKELAAGFWLDNSGPHLELEVKLSGKTPGPVVKFLSNRTVDPRVLHFAPEDSFITLTAPLVGEPGDYTRLLAVLQKWAALVRPVNFQARAHSTPDGRRLITSARDGLKLWDTESGQLLRTIPLAKVESAEPWPQRLLNLSISADGQRIVTIERGKTGSEKKERRAFLVTVWDAETGKQTHFSKLDLNDGLAISPDGKRIAYAESSGRLVIADIADPKKILHDLEGDSTIESNVIGICFSPDGKRIACSYRNGNIKVWTTEPRSRFHRIKARDHSFMAMSFSPDAKYFAAAYVTDFDPRSRSGQPPSPSTIVKVFDAVKGDEVAAFPTQGMLSSLSFAPDGKRLLLATDTHSLNWPKDIAADNSVKVWDLDKKKDVLTLRGESAITLAMTADGKRIVRGNSSGQVKVWDTSDSKELLSLSDNPMTRLIRQLGAGLATPVGKELAASVHSATLVGVTGTPGSEIAHEALVILEMKDEAVARAFMDLVPFLLGNGQKAQTRAFGKHTIHSLPVDRDVWEFSLQGLLRSPFVMGEQSYGREGNIIVLGPSPGTVARSLSGGVARSGFAAQPDVARTLSRVKDANGLVVWSVRTIAKNWLREEEAELAETMKKFAGKAREGNPSLPTRERELVQHGPQQFKKFAADLNRAMLDLPAGSLTVTSKTDRLTISGGHPGLQTMLPRLIDALVEWDLSRPRFYEKPRHEKPGREGFPGFPFPDGEPPSVPFPDRKPPRGDSGKSRPEGPSERPKEYR